MYGSLRFSCAARAAFTLLSLLTFAAHAAASPDSAHASGTGEEYVLSWSSLHMGTVIQGKVFGKTAEDTKRFASLVESEVRRYDEMMSVHAETPLNEVNRRSGQPVEVTPEIAEMTKRALEASALSEGTFDPTIGPVVNLWKIGFGGENVPSDKDIRAALTKVDASRVRVTEKEGRWFVQIDPGQFLDMGGIAKGYIGEKLTELLRTEGAPRALLDLGGNVAALNGKAEGKPWKVGLQSPDESRGAYFAVVDATDESVITSGAYERYIEKDGRRYGHILDSKTGRPALTDVSSVTIVDKDGARADALCTALFAMGWDRSRQFLSAHPEIRAVLLHADLKHAAASSGLVGRLHIADPKVVLQTIEPQKSASDERVVARHP